MAISRRNVLGGVLAGGLVFGFDPARRSWIGDAAAGFGGNRVPRLDGTLRADSAAITDASDDFGHIIHRTPVAVLEPGSVEDIAKMVRYARQNKLKIAMRGQGHATYGQSQVAGGIVIQSSAGNALTTIGKIKRDRVTVGAGVQWSDLLRATYAQGLTPPVLTDYLELSVGGTLSLGGIGGEASHHGAQVDNVIDLEVVTGRGDIVTCSRERNPGLFEATLAGLGQCGMITQATVQLVPAKTNVTVYNLYYTNIATYVADQRKVLADGRFDYLEGSLVANATGGWDYTIEAASFYSPPGTAAAIPQGLADDPTRRTQLDESYLDFAFRIEPLVGLLKTIGLWATPHPWYACFVPASKAVDYIGDLVSGLTIADTGGGPVLFYPFKRSLLHSPLLRVPDEDFFAFNLLRFPGDPTVVPGQLAQNRMFYDDLVDIGGEQYPLGSIPLTPEDWKKHYGRAFPIFAAAKAWFDPDDVLTPGQGIFPPRRC